MSAAKQSRNQQRKAHYAQLADKSSRNQEQISGPVVGHFETREVMIECPKCGGDKWLVFGKRKCNRCDGEGKIAEIDHRTGRARTVQVIVHDDAKTSAPTKTAKREPNAQKRRRQLAAWGRCHGHRIEGANCRSCGCPADEAQKAA